LKLLFQGSCENIPSGYEAVSLIEALNGPYTPRTAIIAPESPDTPDTDTASAIQAAETLNRFVSILYLSNFFKNFNFL